MEVIVQVTLQSLIILLSQTKTATTGGLTTVFSQDIFGVDAFTAFGLSISWSILSFVRTHTNLIAIHKGFCKITTKIFIFPLALHLLHFEIDAEIPIKRKVPHFDKRLLS